MGAAARERFFHWVGSSGPCSQAPASIHFFWGGADCPPSVGKGHNVALEFFLEIYIFAAFLCRFFFGGTGGQKDTLAQVFY